MIDPREVKILDRNAMALGMETSTLMDNAGRSLADEIMRMIKAPAGVLFVCGKGNNGGDGYVAARYLKESEYDVAVLSAGDPGTDLARTAAVWSGIVPLKAKGMSQKEIEGLMGSCDLIVDGLLGAGARGAPEGISASLIKAMNSSGRDIVSIDIPSGIGYDPCIKAAVTVTFHDVKSNMYRGEDPLPECGRISVSDIGIPEEAATVVGPGDLLRYPIPVKSSKKGDMGKVLVIGGGPYTGAPLLSSMGALRAGADLVRAAVPTGIRNVLAGYSPDIIVEGVGKEGSIRLVERDMAQIVQLIEWSDTVLIGPGAGRDHGTVELLLLAMREASGKGKRIVVDADGIHAMAADPLAIIGDVLITPHAGELKALLGAKSKGVEDLEEATMYFASRSGYVLLCKGQVDLIIGHGPHGLGKHIQTPFNDEPLLVRRNTSGHPAMSKGGTGDVLAGLCAGLMARGMSTFDSACLGAYLNGKAGEAAFERRGYSMCATDMLDEISIIP
ncbi:MAG: NAD(P)H-hydrate dehydratase [Candidatus Thermoplasmatota archaeon]|nr:NAD(P)H-hydrate dehydratase [Candidatus Thermoplasmatota archaeon]